MLLGDDEHRVADLLEHLDEVGAFAVDPGDREVRAVAERRRFVLRMGDAGGRVVRPDDFDLAQVWDDVVDEVSERRTPLRATAAIEPDAVLMCQWMLGTRVQVGDPLDDGRLQAEVRGHSVRSLAGEIAGLGAAIEVLDPPELRAELGRIGRELGATYGDAPTALTS